MKLNEIVKLLDAEVIYDSGIEDKEFSTACGADLMSDVLAFVKHDALLLTGLVNPHSIRTAEMMDINLIVFVRGKRPSAEVIEVAKDKEVTLCTTEKTLFTSCGLLYTHGLTGSAGRC